MNAEMANDLPDLDTARHDLQAAVTDLSGILSEQARRHSQAVRSFMKTPKHAKKSARVWSLLDDLVFDQGVPGGWMPAVEGVLRAYALSGADDIRRALYVVIQGLRDQQRAGPMPRAKVPVDLLAVYQDQLSEMADRLVSLAPELPPVPHPPAFARLRDNVAADAVTEELTALIEHGLRQYENPGNGPGFLKMQDDLGRAQEGYFAAELRAFFLTDAVHTRLSKAVGWLSPFERLAEVTRGRDLGGYGTTVHLHAASREGGPAHLVCLTAEAVYPRFYAYCCAVSVHYLAEVLERMPDYAAASGQGPHQDPVTVYGNVGAINSQVSNSHLSVADAITSIGATISLVEDRGQAANAGALRTLTQAVQHAPELAEEQRAQLLDHVADAAAAPDEPRKRNRAKAAMSMITQAAGASTQLAQVLQTWHEVFSKLT